MNAYSQNNNAWKGEMLGESNTTIGTHGCTITCVAMLAGIDPKEVNSRLRNGGGYAAPANAPTQKNLILWTKIQACIPWLQFEWRGYSYTDEDNVKVAAAIAKNGGCLVAVDGTPIGGGSKDGHWVLYIGNQKMIDPWDGKTKPTSSYKATGYAIINKVGEPPTSGGDPWIRNSDNWRGLIWWLQSLGYQLPATPEDTSLDNVKDVIGGIKSRVTTVEKERDQARSDLSQALTEVENQKDKLANKMKECQQTIELKEAEISALKASAPDIAKLKEQYESTTRVLQNDLREAQKAGGLKDLEIAKLKSQLEAGSPDCPSCFDRLKSFFNKILGG